MSKADSVNVLVFIPVLQRYFEMTYSKALTVAQLKDLTAELLAADLNGVFRIDEDTLVYEMNSGLCLDPQDTLSEANLSDWQKICFF